MITSRRDYLLRIIDEVSRLIARLILKRQGGSDLEALEIVVQGFERLFNLERDKLFQFNPDQQFVMLTLDEPPDVARDKALLYAALSDQAGRTYTKMRNEPMAVATYTNALRFILRSREFQTDAPLPEYAPKVDELIALIGDDRLPPDIIAMLTAKPNA